MSKKVGLTFLRKLALVFAVVPFVVGGMAHAAASLPDVGTKTVMNGKINTNVEVINIGQKISLFTFAKPHITCVVIAATTTGNRFQQRNIQITSVHQEFSLLPDLQLGPSIVISANPNRESTGTIISQAIDSELPAVQTVNLFVVAEVNGMKLVNQEPVVFVGEIDQWPPNGSQYYQQGSTDFYMADENLEPTGKPVLRFFGSDVTLLAKFTNLSAIATVGGISLAWTATERNNAGFYAWRGQPLSGQCTNDASNYPNPVRISGLVPSQGDTNSGFDYTYLDSQGNQNNCYAIEAIDFNGGSTFSAIVPVQ
ncbi:hypothetical protein THII_0008 [Thioploca ingrica]|uniref:Secreted protein n=1 Tax=Thioploca ingrica TaxID=40754 RepID=A0A090AHU3_9GAMM|nr:hypothetical protein THII_0008 [Thioploca ingrica]